MWTYSEKFSSFSNKQIAPRASHIRATYARLTRYQVQPPIRKKDRSRSKMWRYSFIVFYNSSECHIYSRFWNHKMCHSYAINRFCLKYRNTQHSKHSRILCSLIKFVLSKCKQSYDWKVIEYDRQLAKFKYLKQILHKNSVICYN